MFVLVALLLGCADPKLEFVQAEAHLAALRSAGLVPSPLGDIEVSAGRPVLVSCVVLLPREPELSWGHQVVAVGRAEVGGTHYVGVIDNFFTSRIAGSIRWFAEDQVSQMVLVRRGR